MPWIETRALYRNLNWIQKFPEISKKVKRGGGKPYFLYLDVISVLLINFLCLVTTVGLPPSCKAQIDFLLTQPINSPKMSK